MPDQHQQPHPRHHLLIAGTGRAGTSFLVRWLAAAGLRTHLTAHDTPMWDDDANAGLEDLPLVTDWQAAPYVMKSPWLVEVIDDVLANPQIVLDGVIIPVRDLTEAASSRVVQELQAAHRKNPWMAGLSRTFEQWGTTPGGVVYSLDPVDQARLLAVSFHRLVQRLVQADIPVVLLDFPRLALDADYLFGKLRRFVPATAAQALAAHAELADPEKIRVGRELAAAQPAGTPDPGCAAHDRLDAVALRREVQRLLGELAAAARAATAQQDAAENLRCALDVQAMELAGLAPGVETGGGDRQASDAQVATLIATVAQRRAEAEHAAAAQLEAVAALRATLEAQAAKLAGLVALLEARDADRQAAQAHIATLTAAAEQLRTEAGRAAMDHQAAVAGLHASLDAQTAELAGLGAALRARDADLEAAHALAAGLNAVVERQGAEADRAATAQQEAATAQQELVAGLRGTLDAQAAELAGLAAALQARGAQLEAAQAESIARAAVAEQLRADAEHAATAHRAEVSGLRGTLDARAAEVVRLEAALETRDTDLAAAQARAVTLASIAEQQRADAEHAAAAQQTVATELRGALDAQAGELARLTATLQSRDAGLGVAQARIAALTAAMEQGRLEAEHAAAEQRELAAGLRNAVGTQAVELAGLAAALEARDTALAASQAQVATLTAEAEQQLVAAAQAAVAQQETAAALRGALDAKAAEAAELAMTLQARDAALELAQAQVATLTAAAEERRVAAERAAREHHDLVASLRSALDTNAAELAGLGAALAARNADLAAAQAHIATLAETAARLREERDSLLASWSWRAGRPLRLAGHAAQAAIRALRPARPPLA